MPVDLREVRPETVALIPRAMAAKHKVFPYQLRGKTLFLMMIDPSDHGAVAKVGFTLGYIVRPIVVPEFRMIQLLRDYYGVDVNVAARIAAAARADEVLVSEPAQERLSDDSVTLQRRRFRAKGAPKDLKVFIAKREG